MKINLSKTETKDYKMIFNHEEVLSYDALNIINQIKEQNENKLSLTEQFKTAKTIEEAKKIAEKIIPNLKDTNQINIGNTTITIINKNDFLRISINTDKYYTSYNFQ